MREREVEATWTTRAGDRTEVVTLRWENGGWTLDGRVSATTGDDVAHDARAHQDLHYVLRTDADWRARQFLLFRDDDEPDLWLASDGDGRWGEVNGAWRDDLTGCHDIQLVLTPVAPTLPVRRSGLAVGASHEALVAAVDPETLQVAVVRRRTTRLDERVWRFEDADTAGVAQVLVDEHGLLLDDGGDFFRRHP